MLLLVKFFTSPLFKVLALIGLVVGIIFGTYTIGYNNGINKEKVVEVKAEKKAEAIVIEKTTAIQGAADANQMVMVVYRDRVETKYKNINTYITTYEKQPASLVTLDPVFVRLHDDSASPVSDPTTTPGSTSGTTSDPSSVGATNANPAITTGQAITVIADNYKEYNICREKVIKWNALYSWSKDKVNSQQP